MNIDLVAGILVALGIAIYIAWTIYHLGKKKNKVDALYDRPTIITDNEISEEMDKHEKRFPITSVGFAVVFLFSIVSVKLILGAEAASNIVTTALSTLISITTWRFFCCLLFGPILFLGLIILISTAVGKIKSSKQSIIE